MIPRLQPVITAIFALAFIGCFKETLQYPGSECEDKPSATFYMSQSTGKAPVAIHFTNTTIGGNSYKWDFGNGSTSTLESPSHTYNHPGVYTITLVAKNSEGCKDTVQGYLEVTDQVLSPDACFTIVNNNCTAPCTVTLSNCSSHADSYWWDFGDGTTSTLANPDKLYNQPGSYTVTLTAYGNNGQSDTQTGVVTISGPSVTIDMVSIPATYFKMGCTQGDNSCFDNELPAHWVQVNGFKMGVTEITQAQWEAVMGSNPSQNANCPECPVESISWYDAIVFCNRLSEMHNLTPCYYSLYYPIGVYGKTGNSWSLPNYGEVSFSSSNSGYRLPTEAEWETAARANYANFVYSGSNSVGQVAVYNGNSGGKPNTVKSKYPNAFGLYDMSGNVWEWCYDWFGYYNQNTAFNPLGPYSGPTRVCRGGHYSDTPEGVRVSFRASWHGISDRYATVGLRVARNN